MITISLQDIPVYGEGSSREEAVESLVDAMIDFSAVYEERVDLFGQIETPETQARMLKLLRRRGDRHALRRALGL